MDDEFELPGDIYSVSDVQSYTKHIIKKHETLIATAPIYVYINRINNRLVFEIQNGYKLDKNAQKNEIILQLKKVIDKP